MTVLVNPVRGEAEVAGYRLRPSFTALVAAEAELGPLFALVERAAGGELRLAEVAALFWYLIDPKPEDLAIALGALRPAEGPIADVEILAQLKEQFPDG